MNGQRELDTLTYTALKTFRNCRKMYDLRYNRKLVPIEEDDSLALGAVFHRCMERWYLRETSTPPESVIAEILDFIDGAYPDRAAEDRQRKNWHLARAMFLAYADRYPNEDFNIIAVEKEFTASIINPETDCASRTFIMRGKADAVVEKNGEYFLMEHKTAASINGDYLERLPLDTQVTLYAHYLGESLNIRISGIIYNVVAKAQIRQSMGETEEEFQTRRAELLAKSKTGKTTAKRRTPESDDEFQERLAAKYRESGMFHRELLYLSLDQIENLKHEIWGLGQEMLHARRTNRWYLNTDFCFIRSRPCAFWPICRSGDNPNVIENLYRTAMPHPELEETAPVNDPAF